MTGQGTASEPPAEKNSREIKSKLENGNLPDLSTPIFVFPLSSTTFQQFIQSTETLLSPPPLSSSPSLSRFRFGPSRKERDSSDGNGEDSSPPLPLLLPPRVHPLLLTLCPQLSRSTRYLPAPPPAGSPLEIDTCIIVSVFFFFFFFFRSIQQALLHSLTSSGRHSYSTTSRYAILLLHFWASEHATLFSGKKLVLQLICSYVWSVQRDLLVNFGASSRNM